MGDSHQTSANQNGATEGGVTLGATDRVGKTQNAVALALLVALSIAFSACSTGSADSTDRWIRGYLDPPNRVWAAIHQTLDELGYEVEKENRADGTIRAVAAVDSPHKGLILKIDQIMRTDVVRVHVHAGTDSSSSQPDPKRLDAAASGFLTLLDSKLTG